MKYRALLLEEGAPGAKLGVVFYYFWQNVVSAFVEANAEVCLALKMPTYITFLTSCTLSRAGSGAQFRSAAGCRHTRRCASTTHL